MKEQKGIAIIGSGNVAWHLALGFYKVGVKINCIINRTEQSAKELAEKVNANYSSDYTDIPFETEIVFICVSDSVITKVATSIANLNYNIVHTSGSVPLSSLNSGHKNIGVFYPFQTFSKQYKTGELNFPICIEAKNDEFRNTLSGYANKISDKVEYLDSNQRMQLHISGVVFNNFSNHLAARTFDFLEKQNIDKELLLPIINETVNKIQNNNPKYVQTGPAMRGDKEIIKKHLDLLNNNTQLQKIYEVMSNSIVAYYSKDNK